MLVGLKRPPSMEEMLRAVSLVTNVYVDSIKDVSTRKRDEVRARALMCFVVANISKISEPEVALKIGWAGHTTCLKARQRWELIRNSVNLISIGIDEYSPFDWEIKVLDALSMLQRSIHTTEVFETQRS